MRLKDAEQPQDTPVAAPRNRASLAAILVSSLATSVLVAVIIAGSLYVYRLFPNMRTGSVLEELLGWAVILVAALACLGVLLLGNKLRRRYDNTPRREK